jgi:hypothetical protein
MAAQPSESIAIPLSKRGLAVYCLGGAAFAALGIWLFLNADDIRPRSPLFVKAVAVVCVGFFGLIAVKAGAKLFDRSPGLIIDGEGIVDNSGGLTAGRIPWSNIKRIRTTTSAEQRFLTIEVRRGRAVHISANALRIDFDDLVKVVTESHAKYTRV